MTDIEAILDLALATEPAAKIKPKFHLWSDDKGVWHANVSMDRYYVQTDGHDAPEKALTKLRADLTGLNQSFLKRITAALKRWVGAETPLRSVDDGGPADPPKVDPPKVDPPKVETPKVETPTATTEAEPSSGETAKPETDNDNPEVDASRKGEPK